MIKNKCGSWCAKCGAHLLGPSYAKMADNWFEELGPVIWFKYPIDEAPWVGTPLWGDWVDDYYTHFLPLPDLNNIGFEVELDD